jgi:hypothetical protein
MARRAHGAWDAVEALRSGDVGTTEDVDVLPRAPDDEDHGAAARARSTDR